MKINFLLTAITLTIASSCSTSYKTGQTPDDVYYSPARLQTDEVRRDDDKNAGDNTVYTSTDDRDIRRRIHNRRYRRYDDRNYPYGYPVYGNPKTGTTQNTQQPRKTNLGAYTPTVHDTTKSSSPKFGNTNNTGTNPVRTFSNPGSTNNSGSAVGKFIRKLLTPDNSSNNNNTSNNGSPARTFDNSKSSNNSSPGNSNSTNNSSGSQSSSNNSAPVRTFKNN